MVRFAYSGEYGIVVCYKHHDAWVHGKRDLVGRHREHCLCFDCGMFVPNQPGNCHIAEQLFELCQKYNLTTPVFECGHYMVGPANLTGLTKEDETKQA